MRQALAAIYYGDLLMTLRAQTQPYELEAGAAERLQNALNGDPDCQKPARPKVPAGHP